MHEMMWGDAHWLCAEPLLDRQADWLPICGWPASENRFVQRMASNVKDGLSVSGLGCLRLLELVGMASFCRQNEFPVFELRLRHEASSVVCDLKVLGFVAAEEPVLMGFEACGFPSAMEWCATHYPHVLLMTSPSGDFWISVEGGAVCPTSEVGDSAHRLRCDSKAFLRHAALDA